MMKSLRWILLFLLTIGLLGSYNTNYVFVTGDVDVAAGVTKTNGVDFTSKEVPVRVAPLIALTVIFERAAGSSSTVDFAFEVSYDGGTTWATFKGVAISVRTDHSVVSGNVVRVFQLVNVPGASHIRWKSVLNNDSGNNITKCNVVLSK